jgi:hypothetical protein
MLKIGSKRRRTMAQIKEEKEAEKQEKEEIAARLAQVD